MLDEAERRQAADQLGTLAAVNHGFAGGSDYSKLARRLARRAGHQAS